MLKERAARIDKLKNRRVSLMAQISEFSLKIKEAHRIYDDSKVKILKIRRVKMNDELMIITVKLGDLGVIFGKEDKSGLLTGQVQRFRSRDRSVRHHQEKADFIVNRPALATV